MPFLTRYRVFSDAGLDKRIWHRVSFPKMKEETNVIWESKDGKYRFQQSGGIARVVNQSGNQVYEQWAGDMLCELMEDIGSGRVELKTVVPVKVLWTSRCGSYRLAEDDGTMRWQYIDPFWNGEGDEWGEDNWDATNGLLSGLLDDIQSGRVKITVEE